MKKAIRATWNAVRWLASEVFDLLTLASPKPGDEEAGVDLSGQGRGRAY